MPDVTRTPVLDLADSLRRRELSAVELLDACLEEVDRTNDEINAVVWRDDERARAAARKADERLAAGDEAPFLGVPLPVKDVTDVQGWPLTYGSRGAADTPSSGPNDLCVDAFLEAGFVIACKTNSSEFGHITTAENLRFGSTRNPWDRSRTSGGSSGGSAAATAAGMFPAAHANDGAGSIRVPASCCGLVGLKPSRGRVPRLSQSWLGGVVEGSVTRTVADTAALLDVIAGPDPLSWYNAPAPERPFREEAGADAGRVRIGLMDHGPYGMPIDPDCAEAARRTAAALEELGHHVEPVDVPTIREELIGPFNLLVAASLGELVDEIDFEKVEPHNAHQFTVGRQVSSIDYVHAAKELERLSREILAESWRGFDVLLTPTMAITPPPLGAIMEASHANPEEPGELLIGTVTFTAFANISGQPAISLPVHWTDDGVPVGVQLLGSPFDEATILRLAGAVEEALPWADREPALAGA